MAARQFYEAATTRPAISKALNEYSTLMDSFSKIQRARCLMRESNYDDSLALFSTASEILRATIHFAFLAPYTSACASLETASMESDPALDEKFEALRNSIALLEQSKLALALRDANHPTLGKIDALLKFAISKALLAEGESLDSKGDRGNAERKYAQFVVVNNEYLEKASLCGLDPGRIEYFPIDDFERALKGAFLSSIPVKDHVSLMNVGSHTAYLQKLGDHLLGSEVGPGDAFHFPLEKLRKGRFRISYRDLSTQELHDEACISLL